MENDQLMVSRPDRWAGVVLMNMPDHIAKLKFILSGQTKFEMDKLSKDLTRSTGKRITNFMKELLKQKLINNKSYNNLKPRGCWLPYMYGVPKSLK